MKNTMKNTTLGAMSLLLAIAAFAGATLPACAQNTATTTPPATTPATPVAAPNEDPWQFSATIPLWAPQINGDATIRGHQENVDVSFSQLKDHLDASFSLGLNANKGKFGLFSSVGYMKFSAGDPNANASLKFLIVNGGASYLLVKTDGEHPFVLAGTAGIRYWYTDTTLTIPAYGIIYQSKVMDLVDPVIGLKGSQYFTPKFHLDFAGDVGGFDISHDTDITWSATGVLTYDFARWFSLSAGYSALAIDESQGSGTGKNGVNLIFNGALVTATFKF